MQNAKDSFYLALRARLAALNPQRIVLLRGATRPGIVVEEAEAPFAQFPNDIFMLRWKALDMDGNAADRLMVQQCEILYASCGTDSFGGLDRGRALSEMDAELIALLHPKGTQKYNYTTTPPTAMQTKIFWDAPVFAAITTVRDCVSRSATVTVYSYEEAGER